MNALIFCGPTLPDAAAHSRLSATFLPPAARGDVYRACRRRPWAIGLIDGYFEHHLSVWHKEVLWALKQGIRVYGAASMGALRAVELEAFGMIGVGSVFELYKSGVLEDDDEVAVLHHGAAQGYASVSEALVDLRASFERAVSEGVVRDATGAALIALAKSAFYPERSLAGVLALGAARGLPEAELARLREWLPLGRVQQKRADALRLLERMASDAAAPAREPPAASFHFEHTEAWDELVRRESRRVPAA